MLKGAWQPRRLEVPGAAMNAFGDYCGSTSSVAT